MSVYGDERKANWVKQSKRDLGFIEGDLIECLNAGDGSWWVGRLFRDRRTVGSFPSNFVQVLPEDFRPATTKSVSPLPPTIAPTGAKAKPFRRPFEAYAKAPHYTSAKTPITFKDSPAAKEKPVKANPVSRTKSAAAPAAHSPSPPPNRGYAGRSMSPNPQADYDYDTPSPSGSFRYRENTYDSEQYEHRESLERSDSPPPPPPPHKHVQRLAAENGYNSPHNVSRQGSNSGYNAHHTMPRQSSNGSFQESHNMSRQASHASYREGSYDDDYGNYETPQRANGYSASPSQMTPSPLREAMDGVMEQLDQLEGLGGGQRSPTPEEELEEEADPWAPESFDMVDHSPSRGKSRHYQNGSNRPKTASAVPSSDEGYETWSGDSSQTTSYRQDSQESQGLPQLSNYVERMEKRFQKMHQHSASTPSASTNAPPAPPPKNQIYTRPTTASGPGSAQDRILRHQQSAFEMRGNRPIGRSGTTKTTVTNASTGNQSNTSHSTQSSGHTLWSGVSAGGFSSTSAGSMARTHHMRAQSAIGVREADIDRPDSPFTGVTYHSSHASNSSGAVRPMSQAVFDDSGTGLGGLVQPKAPKRNIFKKIFDSAKTGVASNRGHIAAGSIANTDAVRSSPFNRAGANGNTVMTGFGNQPSPSREGGSNGAVDWVQVRRDVNRSNSLSKIERAERRDRCQIQDHSALNPVDELYEGIEGDEGADGQPIIDAINYQSINFAQVDKNSRFISEPPPMTTAISLATTYVCRPYRSDVQRLRAIFTWVSEKISWEDEFEGEINTRDVIESKRGCAEEYAVLVMEMCTAVGIPCEVVRGYLKPPGDVPDTSIMPKSNHWWNAVLIDNEWRMMDCCLASPSNPKRPLYSSAGNSSADFWWFLARPTEICWTHVPEHHDQQHIVPPVAHEVLLSLPCACPAFFKDGIEMVDYNTSQTRIEDLEMAHLKINVPPEIEIIAEVEARSYSRDFDGDVFESGDIVKKRALAQAEWYNGIKRYTIKALLPGDEGHGTLKIYAGNRGLMHSIKDIPHPLAFSVPLVHSGENPPYEFVTRHPTPHAQRNDIYVVQPQCQRLALNNTFVFAIRQHPSSAGSGPSSALTPSSNPGGTSPIPFMRPSSAMSVTASSANGSQPSSASGTVSGKKPAKLAIQTPGGKILRLTRKEDRKGITVTGRNMDDEDVSDGGTWETIIKCSERGVWRGLVLADRTARWCVFAEWVCVG